MKTETNRNGRTFHGIKPITLLCVVGTLLVSGCVSQRVTTNLKPGANAALTSPAGRFYVAGIKYTDTGPQDQQSDDADVERTLLPLIRKECFSRYPALFANDAANAIPLGVEMRHSFDPHSGKLLAWMLCTADICGTILPAPADQDDNYVLKTGVWNGRDGIQGAPLEKDFQDQLHIWCSVLSPAGLITIPGESDFPKMSGTILSVQSEMETGYQELAQQVATALAQLVVTKDQEYWTVPMYEQRSSSQSPVPSVLPPSTESAQPF